MDCGISRNRPLKPAIHHPKSESVSLLLASLFGVSRKIGYFRRLFEISRQYVSQSLRQEKLRQIRYRDYKGFDVYASVPMLRYNIFRSAIDKPQQYDGHQVYIIHLPDERNKIRDEIERCDYIDNRAGKNQLIRPRNSRIAHHTVQQLE